MSLHENYSVERVPAAARLPFWGVALVHMGMLTALDQFMLGATLGHSMSYAHAFMAITAGSLIFFVATFGLGYAGMREGISGSLLARWCGFGRGGVPCWSVCSSPSVSWDGLGYRIPSLPVRWITPLARNSDFTGPLRFQALP